MEQFKNKNELQIAIDIAQDPFVVCRIRKTTGLGVHTIMTNLRHARSVLNKYLTTHEDSGVKEVDDDFKAFYKSGNGDVGYYIGLFSILKKAGYERYEIQGVTMEQDLPTNPEQIKTYIALTEEAFNTVFKNEQ